MNPAFLDKYQILYFKSDKWLSLKLKLTTDPFERIQEEGRMIFEIKNASSFFNKHPERIFEF